jgi:YD repeat-containing protein
VTYEYDRANRLIKVTDWLSNATEYTFDSADNLIKTAYPNGYIITYEYDNGGRLKSTDLKPDGTMNAVYKYAFDQLGNRTTILL